MAIYETDTTYNPRGWCACRDRLYVVLPLQLHQVLGTAFRNEVTKSDIRNSSAIQLRSALTGRNLTNLSKSYKSSTKKMMELREVVRNFYVFFFHGLPLLSSVSVSDHLQTTLFIRLIVFYQRSSFFLYFHH